MSFLAKHKRRSRWLSFFGLRLWLALMILVVVGRVCIFRPATNYPGAHFNQGTNAAWLGVEWVNELHDVEEITTLAHALDQRQIRLVFVYASYLESDGRFNPTYAHAAGFVQTLKAAHPDLNVQAWVGLPLRHVDLSDIAVRKEIVKFCVDLVQDAGFDGLHFDPEPIPSDDADVLALLDEVRDALGPEHTLSIATRRIWPILPDVRWPVVGQVAWRASYYREIASRVDQVAVMTYDSAMPLALLYRQWMRFQVIEISRAVDGTGVQLFFGIPTSEERTWTHWPGAENMRSGLRGLIEGLNDAEARPAAVTGVAIYPYWDTGETEWVVYETLWLGQ
ncbi:MAG: hypothetical protein DRI80_17600 [Chloroflexota bacterium]|nr:MAG: hypothetical protein DRI80_17600 [Chloroflexota bacterium]